MENSQHVLLQQLFPTLEGPLIEEMLQASTRRKFYEGEDIIRNGQYLQASVMLLSGLVKVYRQGDDGEEFLMYYLEPGDACALSMLSAAREEQSQLVARAVKDSDCILVPQHQSEIWLAKYKSWYSFVIGTYRARFEELLHTLDSVAFTSMDERLVFYLRRYLNTQGALVHLSHQQIADDLNSSREVISRLLKKLEQRGALELHRNYLEIKNLHAH